VPGASFPSHHTPMRSLALTRGLPPHFFQMDRAGSLGEKGWGGPGRGRRSTLGSLGLGWEAPSGRGTSCSPSLGRSGTGGDLGRPLFPDSPNGKPGGRVGEWGRLWGGGRWAWGGAPFPWPTTSTAPGAQSCRWELRGKDTDRLGMMRTSHNTDREATDHAMPPGRFRPIPNSVSGGYPNVTECQRDTSASERILREGNVPPDH
jgi:hypothetical protein